MKIIITGRVIADGKQLKIGKPVDVDDDTGAKLVRDGYATQVAEAPKAPAKDAK